MLTQEQKSFLNEHIPYKLTAIDLCQIITRFICDYGDSYPTVIQLGTVKEIRAKNSRLFTNAVVEHGFMSCRAILEFLGIGLNPEQIGLSEYRKQRADTATLELFNLPLLTVSNVEDCLQGDQVLIDGLVRTIRAGHKGGAHLTMGSEKSLAAPLEAGCKATRSLVNHFLYEKLSLPSPPLFFQ